MFLVLFIWGAKVGFCQLVGNFNPSSLFNPLGATITVSTLQFGYGQYSATIP